MSRCRLGASRAATAGLLAAFDPVLYVSALSERGGFAATQAKVGASEQIFAAHPRSMTRGTEPRTGLNRFSGRHRFRGLLRRLQQCWTLR